MTGRSEGIMSERSNAVEILGMAGSLREASYNRALLRAARELLPQGVELEEFDLRGLPLYDGDVEAAGDPGPVAALKEAIRVADALLIATPEYNRGVPGVLKNAVDWASRPPLASPLTGKPVAIMGASTGRGGTARAQDQLRAALEFSRANVIEQPEVLVPEAFMRFDERCELVDPGIRAELAELIDTLVQVAGGVTLAA
jgi:chromate reductase